MEGGPDSFLAEKPWATALCDRLGLDPNEVTYVQGDTNEVFFGEGTGGSRSATIGGGSGGAGPGGGRAHRVALILGFRPPSQEPPERSRGAVALRAGLGRVRAVAGRRRHSRGRQPAFGTPLGQFLSRR